VRQHVWVAPFYEDDVTGIIETIGAERVLFGSDWPHPEGLAEPIEFVDSLTGQPDAVVRKIMRDNARELLRLA
jgi:predicted TIM-barrel fold metal-dependent hydrolase